MCFVVGDDGTVDSLDLNLVLRNWNVHTDNLAAETAGAIGGPWVQNLPGDDSPPRTNVSSIDLNKPLGTWGKTGASGAAPEPGSLAGLAGLATLALGAVGVRRQRRIQT